MYVTTNGICHWFDGTRRHVMLLRLMGTRHVKHFGPYLVHNPIGAPSFGPSVYTGTMDLRQSDVEASGQTPITRHGNLTVLDGAHRYTFWNIVYSVYILQYCIHTGSSRLGCLVSTPY